MAVPFDRLGTTAETWRARLKELSRGRLLGRFPPRSADLRLRKVSLRLIFKL
jgi:hypothetical protein